MLRKLSRKETWQKFFKVDPEFAHLPIKERWRLSKEKRNKSGDEGARNTKVDNWLLAKPLVVNNHVNPSLLFLSVLSTMVQRANPKKSSFLLKYCNIDLESTEDANLSFRERWRKRQEQFKRDGDGALAPMIFMRSLMVFQAPTQLYAFLWHIVPYLFSDYSPWTQYYLKVLCCFVLVNGLANWFCVILYDPSYPKTKDNPFLEVKNRDQLPDHFVPFIERSRSNANGHSMYEISSKDGLEWSYCDKCDMHIPPRACHCKYCKKCILKRDHHCFMVGNCIGFKNQRYFAMLAFYAMITGLVGGFFNYRYVKQAVWPELYSWGELFFPVAIWKSLFGAVQPLHALLILHLYLEAAFGLIGTVYFISQMTVCITGKTLYEVSHKLPVKNNNSISRNMRSVFGEFWALNFLFPMTLIFRQRDDGIHWENIKIDHNANKTLNGSTKQC